MVWWFCAVYFSLQFTFIWLNVFLITAAHLLTQDKFENIHLNKLVNVFLPNNPLCYLFTVFLLKEKNKNKTWTRIFLNPLSPPHLSSLHPPRRSPDRSTGCLLPEMLFSLPPIGRRRCSGWSVAAGVDVSSGRRGWKTVKLPSLLWPIPTPSRDGIPVYDGPRSQRA